MSNTNSPMTLDDRMTDRMADRMTGAVRVLKQGHGFIAGDDGNNYYLHWTAMRPDTLDFRQLRERERLNFAVVPNPRKDAVPRAVDVYVISADRSFDRPLDRPNVN